MKIFELDLTPWQMIGRFFVAIVFILTLPIWLIILFVRLLILFGHDLLDIIQDQDAR